MTAPRLALLFTVTAIAGAAWCWHASGVDRGDDIGRALRSGQWQLAQQRIDAHRSQHGRSAELARWQTALDLAARGPQVAREGQVPVEAPVALSIDIPSENPEFAAASRATVAAGTVPASSDRDDHGVDAPAVLVTR